METVLHLIKYLFVAGVGVELVLMARALYRLARDKSGPAAAPPAEK